jgi:glycosyltransferase involved in cell wall biosynthesis
MAAPIISVCIPTYNGSKYLDACLRSVQRQSFAHFEVLIVDDNSTDDTCNIVRTYTTDDPRFRLIRNKNRLGLVANWNRCARLASTKWVKFLFQDDLLLPECLERLMAATSGSEVAFVACRRGFHFESGTSDVTQRFYATNGAAIDQLFESRQRINATDFARTVLGNITANNIGEPTATLVRRELFDRFGYFNEQLAMCCDSEYWSRIGTHVGVTFIPETLAIFRVHGDSTSALNFGRRRFTMDFIDPLIVSHEFAFNPHYDNLRRAARFHFGSGYITSLCRVRTRSAFETLKGKLSIGSEDAAECQREWDRISMIYPHVDEFSRAPGFFEKTASAVRLEKAKAMMQRMLRPRF